MTAKPVPSTRQLLRASSDDEAALAFPLPHSGFGFHAQQAVEKLYKALIVDREGHHPYSHDLVSLRKRVESLGLHLPGCTFSLERLSDYAGEARYNEPIPLQEEERSLLRTCIAALRAFVLSELQVDSIPQPPSQRKPGSHL